MSQKILGIDLGTNSLGIALRDPEREDQLEFFSSIIFQSGVGAGELSFAAERRKRRSTRRLYQARKYRIWATLRLLIDHGCCPLSNEDLERWCKYDKNKGLKRQYPIEATEFEQWVRLDFNGDGKPDFSSPYQLRAKLMEEFINWDDQTDRFKFGRAMYHIAQRRGFKSSKGEILRDIDKENDETSKDGNESGEIEMDNIKSTMQKSEEKRSKNLDDFMNTYQLKTIGCAFAKLEKDGIRVRNSEFKAIQSQYIMEVKAICEFQHIDTLDPELYTGLISTKKNEGTIFFRRPLRKQTGTVGKCFLEQDKRRCPISHPDFEEFRALSFINNIKFRLGSNSDWQSLTAPERIELFDSCFTRAKSSFKFEDIRRWLEKKYFGSIFSYDNHTINYPDDTSIAGCPVINRLKKILGSDWRNNEIVTDKTRPNHVTRKNNLHDNSKKHIVRYDYTDIWHLVYSNNSDNYEDIEELVRKNGYFSNNQIEEITQLWKVLQEGYSSLSIRAIHNILPFLREGMIYSKAVAFAKIPDIIGDKLWREHRSVIIDKLNDLSDKNEYNRRVYGIVNTLISNFKLQKIEGTSFYPDTDYRLNNTDKEVVRQCIITTISQKRWNRLSEERQAVIQQDVENLYQEFFASSSHDYYKTPRQIDDFKSCLAEMFPNIPEKKWNKLYHHSETMIFPHQNPHNITVDDRIMNVPQLSLRNISSIKNPVATRALHVLRRAINQMLREGMIDENTRIVVETAREMNDTNWRKAIALYQKEQSDKNLAIRKLIESYFDNKNLTPTNDDIVKGSLVFDQIIQQENEKEDSKSVNSYKYDDVVKEKELAANIQKHKLWEEQKFRCLYTGKGISLSELFAGERVNIEHTIPRSLSFDDSLKNKTICYSYYNQNVKGTHIPTELPNYEKEWQNYGIIKENIKPWEEKVKHIKSQINFSKRKSMTASSVEFKNKYIQQKHLWELKLDYWQTKLRTFTITRDELNLGFRNSQLVDTRIITKYAFHYLKSVFSRVDVQKGETTSIFRKIFGIQSVDETKDRQRHSHHAIDAAVLTMIPTAGKRDRMIELFYQVQDANDAEKNVYRKRLDEEKSSCCISNISKMIDTIEQSILVKHVSRDQTITPAKRKLRKNGKIVYKNLSTKEPYFVQGDCIRGQLHDDTFLSAIKPPKYVKDNDGNYIIEKKDGKTVYEQNCIYVVRKELHKLVLSNDRNSWTWKKLEDEIVNKELYSLMRNQFPEDVSFKEAVARGIYMLDRNGNKIHKIRHIRCITAYKNPLEIKQQTYISKCDYKQHYYANNGKSAYLAIYWDGIMGNKKDKAVRSLLDVVKMKETSGCISVTDCFEKTKNGIPLYAIIRPRTHVIIFDESEVKKGINALSEMIGRFVEMETKDLQKRLYVVNNFEKDGRTVLIHHNEARPDKELGKGSPNIDLINPNPKDRVSINKRYMLVEGFHFTIDNVGKITFINNHD